jgi:hypothetical protein
MVASSIIGARTHEHRFAHRFGLRAPMRTSTILKNPMNWNYLSTWAFPGAEGLGAQVIHPLVFLICGNVVDPLNNLMNWNNVSTLAFPGAEDLGAQVIHPLLFLIRVK